MNSSKPPIAEEHVVTRDAVLREDLVEIVARSAVEGAVSRSSRRLRCRECARRYVAVDEVVAFAGEHFRAGVGAEDDEVLAAAAHHQVEARPGMDHVVAVADLDVVVAAEVA